MKKKNKPRVVIGPIKCLFTLSKDIMLRATTTHMCRGTMGEKYSIKFIFNSSNSSKAYPLSTLSPN